MTAVLSATDPPVADVRPRGGKRSAERRKIPFLRAVGPLLLLAVWSIGSATGLLDPNTLPSPAGVVEAGWRLWQDGSLTDAVGASLARALSGLGIGMAIGLVLALLSGLSRLGTALIDGTVQVWRSIPILAIIPIVIVWIGIGESMKISLIALATAVPIYINTASALSAIDRRYVELADVVGLSRWGFIRNIALPGAIPGFFVGLRLSAVTCWLVLVVVEQTNALSGIGYFMNNAQQFGQVDVLTVGIVLYALFGLTSDTLVLLLQRRALSWRKTFGS